MPLKSLPTYKRDHQHASARTGLSRHHHRRRSGMGISLSCTFGRTKGRASPGGGREVGAGRSSGRQDPALAPRTGRRIAEGPRGAPPEGKEDPAQQPPDPGRPDLDSQEIHGDFRRSRRCQLCDRDAGRGRIARGRRPGIRCGFRSPALELELSQDTPGKGISQGTPGCR